MTVTDPIKMYLVLKDFPIDLVSIITCSTQKFSA